MSLNILLLFVTFQVKHLLGDYVLQTQYMLNKTRANGWIFPLLAHVSVHAGLTLIIILCINSDLWYLAVLDLIIHFAMDRIKASPNLLNRFTMDNKYFWWSLGFDQMVHHLTHYVIIFILLTN